ncbi:MAG: septum formation inhibitor Maf [Rhodocyclaceae bacterium]|nr:septum formation inhibitor Maf [Rhodocyclaceae bacterium]MBX3670420.1 septum formation inhibitor Maf [Rhodocyclaceae bacterium]
MNHSGIYLASQSPRRRELLHQIHVRFEVLLFRHGARADADVSEDVLAGESAAVYCERVARAKASGGIKRLQWRHLPPKPVLAADTTIELDGEIIGKPDNAEHACAILARLSGRTHRVLTAVAVAVDTQIELRMSASEVSFRPLGEAEIQRYVTTGEAQDKAGAYAIQGRAAMFIEHIRGSHSGIVGLPLFETAALLAAAGYPVL